MRAGAEQTGRTPPIVAHVPIMLTTDADAARAVARRQLASIRACPTTAVCSSIPATRRPSAANGRAMIDAGVVHGDEEMVAGRLRTFFAAGVGAIIAAPFPAGGDRDAERSRAYDFLAVLARTL